MEDQSRGPTPRRRAYRAPLGPEVPVDRRNSYRAARHRLEPKREARIAPRLIQSEQRLAGEVDTT